MGKSPSDSTTQCFGPVKACPVRSCPHHVLLPTHRASEVPPVPTHPPQQLWMPDLQQGNVESKFRSPQIKLGQPGRDICSPSARSPTGAERSDLVQPLTGFGASCLWKSSRGLWILRMTSLCSSNLRDLFHAHSCLTLVSLLLRHWANR